MKPGLNGYKLDKLKLMWHEFKVWHRCKVQIEVYSFQQRATETNSLASVGIQLIAICDEVRD